MNRNYQQVNYVFSSSENEFDSELIENRRQKEYRDLYNPFKSTWKAAVGRGTFEEGVGFRKKEFPSGHESFSSSTYRNRYGNYSGAPRHFVERGNSNISSSPYDSDQGRQFGHSTKGIYGESSSLGHQSAFDLEGDSRYGINREQKGTTEANDIPRRNTYGYYTTGYGPRD